MAVILLLIQNFKSRYSMDTPLHGGHSTTHLDFSNQMQTRYAPDAAAILFLIQIQLSTSGSDTLQTRKSFCHLSRSQLQYGYTLDTEVILLLI